MRRLCSAAAFLWVFSSGAIAADLMSVRPGLMCASKEALARLTLPNGDSRTHGPGARASDLQAAAAGGCIDIPRGARVAVQQGFRNTSVVTYSGETLVVPNIDFAPAGSGGGGGAPRLTATTRLEAGDGGTLVLFEDSRITPRVRPDGYTFDQALLDRPGNDAIQLDLFHDYTSNVALYDAWHEYFRKHQPRTLIVWGQNDPFFTVPGAQAFLRDLPKAELHLIDGGHFLLEEHSEFVAGKIIGFMGKGQKTEVGK